MFQNVARMLAPGGVFVFCVEHPIVTANYDGWLRDANGEKRHWQLDNYGSEGERMTEWFVAGVRKYHRTLSTYLNTLLDAGLTITRVVEPVPNETAVAARPAFADEWRRPAFLFVRVEKR